MLEARFKPHNMLGCEFILDTEKLSCKTAVNIFYRTDSAQKNTNQNPLKKFQNYLHNTYVTKVHSDVKRDLVLKNRPAHVLLRCIKRKSHGIQLVTCVLKQKVEYSCRQIDAPS